jgi:hypothetical protein
LVDIEIKLYLLYVLIVDPNTTGNFEVVILNNGELVHSKRAGAGKCESAAERDALFAKIRAFLESSK